MAMTPRRAFGCLGLAARRQAMDDARMFNVVRAAMHADKNQAHKFLSRLTDG